MKPGSELPISDADVFAGDHLVTLAEAARRAEAEAEGAVLRDLRSAVAFLRDRAAVDLETTLASASETRAIFDRLSPGSLGVSRKRLDNVRSLVAGFVDLHGVRRTWVTRKIPLDDAWRDLMDLAPRREYRWALSRLAAFCTVKGTAPKDVTAGSLLGLHAALEAEAVSKNPRNIIKHTIAVWNICARQAPAWPDVRLASPFKKEAYMLLLEAFPASFAADVARFETRMSNPDPLDPTTPIRAYRPDTLKGYRYSFRRLASALVRQEILPIEEITDLRVFFVEQRYREALRPFLPGDQSRDAGHAAKMASQLRVVARTHLGVGAEDLKDLDLVVRRLTPKGAGRMSARNRVRLAQFDDEEVVRRLLRFPAAERDRALKLSNPLRRAKGVERALAVAILIFASVRAKNLRCLRLDSNLRRAGGRVFLSLFEGETKTRGALEIDLPADAIALLDLFLAEHRAALPGSEGSPYLFPGLDGGPRSYSAMRGAIVRALRKHEGIELSPQLFRHITSKIVIESRPELALAVSRRLGHASLNTTYAHYLGTETPAASRRINALLEEVRDV